MLQKLASSLEEKELSPETGISASDEYQYVTAIDTFLQYGDTLNVIAQVNAHGYQGTLTLPGHSILTLTVDQFL